MQENNKPEKLNNSHFRKALEEAGKELAKLVTPEYLEMMEKVEKKSIRQQSAIKEFFDKRKGFIKDFDFNGEDFMNFLWYQDEPFHEWGEEKIIDNMVKFIDFERNRLSKLNLPTFTTSPGAKEQTFESIFPSDEDKEMVMSLLKGLKIINSAGDYLLGTKTGMIRVFIEVMKEEGCFVDIENKKILRLFTPVILGRKVLTIKEPFDYDAMKRQILKKYAELKK